MGKTSLSIQGQDFYINGKPIYSEIEGAGEARGLMMNARFIQGVFDDAEDKSRFHRFGKVFDADKNTDDLIAALPQWYSYGLRAITVCFQGGMPVFTIDIKSIDNNPFGPDGLKLDKAYQNRMDRLIRAADSLGMVIIVNILYWAQTARFADTKAVPAAVATAARFLKEGRYTNIIIDVANEYDHPKWEDRLLFGASGEKKLTADESIQQLIDVARRESGGCIPVGCSPCCSAGKPVADASDVVMIHGNGLTRGQYYDLVTKAKKDYPNKPILCNEDSPCISRLEIAGLTHTSWGHYDNFTKQEPPCDWGITSGYDTFFARRMAKTLGILLPELPEEKQYYLQGLEKDTAWQGKRWIRLAAEYPEKINYVNFYRNGEFIYRSYDEPFFLFRKTTWIQEPWICQADDHEWTAEIFLHDGRIITKTVSVHD